MTTTRRAWRRPVLIVVTLLLVIVAGGFAWDARGRVATVESGKLYRSKAMEPARLVDVGRRLGIRTVIDLRKDGDEVRLEAAALALQGMRHVHLPSTQVPDLATVDRFLDILADSRNYPVLVHCRHGVGRAGVFSAIYRMEAQGWSSTSAIAEAIVMAGGGSFGIRSEKRAFLGQYRLRRDRSALGSPAATRPAQAILQTP